MHSGLMGKTQVYILSFYDDSFTCSFMLRNTDFSFETAVLGKFDQQKPDCTENFSFRLSQLCMQHLAEWHVDVFWERGLFVLAHATFRSYWSIHTSGRREGQSFVLVSRHWPMEHFPDCIRLISFFPPLTVNIDGFAVFSTCYSIDWLA